MRAHRGTWVALALIATTAGCSAKMGVQRIRTAMSPPQISVDQIEPGVTDQDQVRVWFGQPDAVRVDNLGAAEWGYSRDLRRSRIRGAIEQFDRGVAEPLDRFFDEVLFYPPLSRPVEMRAADQLSVSFGPNGVVTQFAYRREP